MKCFRCGNPGHFARDCPEVAPTASSSKAEEGFYSERRKVGPRFFRNGTDGRVNSSKDSFGSPIAMSNQLCIKGKTVMGASAPVTGSQGLPIAAGRLSSCTMPVVKAIVNGHSLLCLVDTGSGCTIVGISES